ncbi:MAG TPA: alpha-amylase family protein [Candidatus Nanopelagicales bacterium]|nr:alpha-amylase family protein [Candidatus Nanopelagicales bacterium]
MAGKLSRRWFLGVTAGAAAAASGGSAAAARGLPDAGRMTDGSAPWFLRTRRWVQTNLNEQDPASYDAALWADYWARVRAQGVIVNAGGIVAFYPSRFEWHHRALALGDRDLFGEIRTAAGNAGLTVLARMDSTRTYEGVFRAHPDWFARDAKGEPFKGGDLYTVCVNGPWVNECVPAILREIAGRYRPDGFTDNSWSGLGQRQICYCDLCREAFRRAASLDLPARVDWDDPVYRAWIRWSYARRTEIWDAYNRATHEAGGPDCHWLGMCQGEPSRMCEDFRDPHAIWSRSPIVMLDWQARRTGEGFQANAIAGKTVHGVLGWDKLAPESTALYLGPTRPMFRKAAKPEPEARLWAACGMAAGIQPWWHHLGASQDDRRQLRTAERLSRWHAENEAYLVDRTPIATVGVAWSETNIDWYGRGESATRAVAPFAGAAEALGLHRIPWRAVHADHVGRDAPELDVLVLPNLAAMSDAQCAAVRRFVEEGGGLVATGETSLYDEEGRRRADFALADLLGAHATGEHRGSFEGAAASPWASWDGHSYLRMAAGAPRPPALEGFEETDILPFGGRVEVVRADPGAEVPLTLVPDSPQSPPENVWMREPRTAFPGLVVHATAGRGRIAFLPADLDRCFGRDRIPDHGRLIANLVRWASRRPMPLEVEGPGLLDVHLYRQAGRLILHVVNLTNPAAFRPYATELVPVGPLRVRLARPKDLRPVRARRLVAGGEAACAADGDWVELTLERVLDHEVVVLE